MSFTALVIGYDEGYLCDDRTLAAAVWRNLLDRNTDVEPGDLLALVDYIHKNLQHLETLSDDQLLSGFISFIPFNSEKVNVEKDNHIRKLVSSI